MLWIDVTDVVEFVATGSTVSGVQRVSAHLTPLLLTNNSHAVALDRSRGQFVQLTDQETTEIIRHGVHQGVAQSQEAAKACLQRIATAPTHHFNGDSQSVLLSLGAVWINDQLMAAIRAAVAQGVRFVDLFYDLTPVIDAGHSPELRGLFERYLALLSDCAARVPAISQSSRRDLTHYVSDKGWRIPPGAATGLPSGLTQGIDAAAEIPEFTLPSEKYALMVGTIEARKNHLLAFDAWQELIARHGADSVPTLVCVGKVGWNSDQFLDKMRESNNLNGKIQLRTNNISDPELAELYRHCEFTVYPSNYEGWGLPVTESIYFGAPVVVAQNSSLPEAGGDLACYFDTGNLDDFVNVIDTQMLSSENYAAWKSKINDKRPLPITWSNIADLVDQEIELVRNETTINPPQEIPELVQWRTYPLSAPHSEFTDRLIIGPQRPPQPWGIPLYRDQELSICLRRPTDAHLTVHLGTLNEPGIVTLSVNDKNYRFSRGEYISIDLGVGSTSDPVEIHLRGTDVGPSDQGFIGLTSIMVEGESAMASEELTDFTVKKLQAENEALRVDIAQLTSELADARAELERKSQGLLSRVSRRLNRP